MLTEKIDPKKFRTFAETNTLINSNYVDGRDLLTRIVQSATLLTEGEASSLLLLNEQNGRLYFEIALGSKGSQVKQYSLKAGEGIAGWVAQHNTSIIVNEVESDPRFCSDISKAVGFPTTSILAVPLRIKDHCLGVIEIVNKKDAKPFHEEDREWLELFANQAAIAIMNAEYLQKTRAEIADLKSQVGSAYHAFIGSSRLIRDKLDLARRIAPSDSSVLILGESGVGKELFAEQIHLSSNRSAQPFVRVNCAALPETLLESELFGHLKGAFTDASSDRRGRFEMAEGGTIFLDEIAEISPAVQAKLLRAIQSKTYEPLGSSETRRADVRIIAATNRDIEQEVAIGRFRNDLYYRLNVLPLHIPPLRQRSEDIPELAAFFLRRFNEETKKKVTGFTDQAMAALLRHRWPGNVRELENTIERAVVLSSGPAVTEGDLSIIGGVLSAEDDLTGLDFRAAMVSFKRKLIIHALGRHGGSQTAAAAALGIQRTYLAKLVKDLDINH
jgi:Nif-specific regulatory protein